MNNPLLTFAGWAPHGTGPPQFYPRPTEAEAKKILAQRDHEFQLRTRFPTYDQLIAHAVAQYGLEYDKAQTNGTWRGRWIGNAAAIDMEPMVAMAPELHPSTWDRHLEMVLAAVKTRNDHLGATTNENALDMTPGSDKTGKGCQMLAADWRTIFKERLWKGMLHDEAFEAGKLSQFLTAADVAKAVHENPKSVNGAAVQTMFDTFQAAAESVGITFNNKSHERRFPVPSSSEVSKAEKVVLDAAEALFTAEDGVSTLLGDSDEASEEELQQARSKLKHFWQIGDVHKYLKVLLGALGVEKITSLAQYPYVIKLVNDGAPTTKLRGCVTLTLSLVDPRTNEEIRNHPQMPKHCFPLACFFEKETKLTIKAGFGSVYRVLRQLERDGIEVNGVRVPLKVIDVPDLSNLWKGTEGVGGAVGTSHWPCPMCPWNVERRSLGCPGGATVCRGFCRAPCHHYDIFSSVGGLALMRMRAEHQRLAAAMQADTVDGCQWFERIRLLTPSLAAAQRAAELVGIDSRGVSLKDLERQLDALATDVVMTDGFDFPAELVSDMTVPDVREQLGFRNMHTTGSGVDVRARLTKRVEDVQSYLELDLELQYPGVLPSSLYPDPLKTVSCALHFEMRTGETIAHHLFSHTLIEQHADALDRLLAAQAAVRGRPGLDFFTLKIGGEPIETFVGRRSILSKCLDPITLSRKHAFMLVRALEDHALPCLMKDDDTPRDGSDNPTPLWKTALSEYVKAVNILRHIPTSTEKIMGEEGYEAQLKTHAVAMQTAADRCTNALVELLSDKCLTNYLHIFRVGHLAEQMMLHGYLAYLNNQAVEAVNGVISCVYHRQGQRGGATGQSDGHGGRAGNHTDAVRKWAVCHVAWATGIARQALIGVYGEDGVASRRARPKLDEHRGCRANGGGGRAPKDQYRQAHASSSEQRAKKRKTGGIGSVVLATPTHRAPLALITPV